jgi:hypothetical protein
MAHVILLLTGVRGYGKTAIAHSIAQYRYEKGVRASSLFFDREISGRNELEILFTIIALDPARSNKQIGRGVLEQERSLTSAPLSRQFDELQWYLIEEYVDTLDKSCGSDLIELLTRTQELPGNHLFITPRPLKEFDTCLFGQHHTVRQTIHIYTKANREDVAIYAKAQLKVVAVWGGMGDNWPQLLRDFTRQLSPCIKGEYNAGALIFGTLVEITNLVGQLS